ncbi:MAG: SLC13 family permease [Thermogutta sp.]
MLEFGAAISLIVVGLIFVLLATTRLAPDVVLMGGLTILLLTGCVTSQEALQGFSNEGMITIAVLFVVGAGLVETGAVSALADTLFGRAKSVTGAIARVMIPTTALSAFINNTPVVSMLIPAINDWARQNRIPPSKLLLPLSYAAILGGTCTLIGTSTNLVVNGLLIRAYDQGQLAWAPHVTRGLGMFDPTWVGLPIAVAGIAFVLISHRWLLPARDPITPIREDPKQYTTEMLVEPGSPLVGKTIEEAGLRHLPGLYLAEINRDGQVLPAVSPQERLRANDRLIFVGVVESVRDLQRIRGLVPATNQVFKLDAPRSQRCLIEAVISERCPIVGKSIRDGRFRSRYNAVVIGVAREGERLRGKIGDIVLRRGDTVLLEAHPSFVEIHRHSRDFYLISRLEDSKPPRFEKSKTALLILAAMVLVVTVSESFGDLGLKIGSWELVFGKITMLKGALLAAAAMLAFQCCTLSEARRAIDWQVLVAIGAAFGIGTALERTGAAAFVAHHLIHWVGQNPRLTLLAIHAITSLTTELVTNNAAAALMFPFALATAQELQVNPMPFVISVLTAASASFATPLGYQTNLMVYGPGGYRFTDYLKIGIPMNILVTVLTVTLAPLIWPFHR